MSQDKDKKVVWMGIVVVLVLLGISVFLFNANMERDYMESGYSVVYLSTGEVYVGHLTARRDFELKDSYILQLNKDTLDPSKNSFQLQPIAEALWAPKSLHINKKNVVFYGAILPTSKIGEALAKKK